MNQREAFEKWFQEEMDFYRHGIEYNVAKSAWYAAAQKVQLMQWHTIETAPMDGTDVLVAMGYGMAPRVAGFFVGGPYGDGWYTFEQPENKIQPTHWMPLPPAP